jgi:non-specific serine/threonine protein kinase/serine/threonine-protein kinase
MTQPERSADVAARAKAVFADALDLPPDARAAHVRSAAGGDADVEQAALSLLRALDSAGGFFAGPTLEGSSVPAAAPITPAAPARVGPYVLREVLGEGGFGIVYAADQESPVRRRVAVKLIKPGMDSRQVIARFEAERQALALMDHPNIARVFDAGTTPSGQPYFVMELVGGVPVTTWCDDHRLSPRQRLELMVPVCQAVHHAHQKGVIHRDIKPSNVLVATVDGRPVPKVIDFGIAKAIDARLTEQTVFTEQRQMIGTPQYMSPEQAGEGGGVDTRTDVYSLGVVMYELLAGLPPFDPKALREKAYGEVQRVIREDDPPRPSTRMSQAQTVASIAALRGLEPRRLASELRGEPDWIVMKCLSKERSRRYDSTAGLAADIRRYLDHEPVVAGPPSGWYRARKLLRRHRVLAGATAAVVVGLGLGLAGALWGLREARRERDAAVAARTAEASARAAEASAREYERQTDRFMGDMVTSIDPENARGKPVLVKDVLDNAARRLDASPPAHAPVEASLRYTFGRTYYTLGELGAALAQAKRSVELYRATQGDTVSVARATLLYGQCLAEIGRHADAEPVLREAVERCRLTLGGDDNDTLYAENLLSQMLAEVGKLDEAERLLAAHLENTRRVRSPESEDAVNAAASLARMYVRRGRYAEAERVWREQLAICRRTRGNDSPTTLVLCSNLADLLRSIGQIDEAIALLTEATEGANRVLGRNHPYTITFGNNRALALQAAGRLDEAHAAFEDTIARRAEAFGPDAPQTLLARSNYALCLQAQKQFDAAERELRDVIDRMKRTNGPGHVDTLIAENNVGWLKADRDDLAAAEAIFRDLLPRTIAAMGESAPVVTSFRLRLGSVLVRRGDAAAAEPFLAQAFAVGEARGLAQKQTLYPAAYGVCLARLNRDADAWPLLTRARTLMSAAPQQADPRWLIPVIESQVAILERRGDAAALVPLRAELASARAAAATRPSGPSTGPATLPAR